MARSLIAVGAYLPPVCLPDIAGFIGLISNSLTAKQFEGSDFKKFGIVIRSMDMMILRTAEEVFEALGGNPGVAQLTDSKATAVANWRALGSFPPNTYVVMTECLRAQGKIAAAALWRMKVPAETEHAS